MEGPLSQSPKKPGARDISDLKARLGLKKAGAPAAAPAGTGPETPPQGAAIPPPSRARGPAVPPPPGTPGHQPRQAPMPDARQDPFAAMNAMAARGAVAAAPEIIVVNDGKPIESVGSQAKGLRTLKLLLPLVIALVIGVVVGQMGTRAKIYNETIDDAAAIAGTVKDVNKSLQRLRDALYTAKERGPGGTSYLVPDPKLTEEIDAMREAKQLEMPDLARVYESNLYWMEQGAVDQTITYLTEASLLFKAVKEHADKAKTEQKALDAVPGRIQKLGLPTRYGVIINIAKDAPVMATFVELGDPICQDGKPNPAGCAGEPKGFLYRPAELGAWGQKSLAEPQENFIPADKLIPLGYDPSPALNALFVGSEATVSDFAYRKRLEDIDGTLDALMERGKMVESAHTNMSNSSKQFTFFQ
jgi:hypothetical protein